jgi:hypothetical protein
VTKSFEVSIGQKATRRKETKMTKISQSRDVGDAGRKTRPPERNRELGAVELDRIAAAGGSSGGGFGSSGGGSGGN